MRPAEVVERYRRGRSDPEVAVLEGVHALKHALRFGAEILDARTRDPDALRALARELAPDVADRITGLVTAVDPELFDALAPTAHPTGVIALARRPGADLAALLDRPGPEPIVLLERPTHHGNIGAVVRVTAAAGAAGVLVTGPHDPWHPGAIRGGAGLQFAQPVMALGTGAPGGAAPGGATSEGATPAPATLRAVLASDRPLVALDPDGEPLRPGQEAVPPRSVLVFGSERRGVSAALLDRADRRLSIPMRPGVSSLNLATAVAVTLYLGLPAHRLSSGEGAR